MPQFSTEAVAGYKIFIYGAPREENPPHFHLVRKNENARFTIRDFKAISPNGIKGKDLRIIKLYWEEHKAIMLQFFCILNPKLCEPRK
jgi:hypothetical protein